MYRIIIFLNPTSSSLSNAVLGIGITIIIFGYTNMIYYVFILNPIETFKQILCTTILLFTVGAFAILKAIEQVHIIHKVDTTNVIIFSYSSLYSLISLRNPLHNPYCDIIRKIQNTHIRAQLTGKHITYMWISGHCNIDGNEEDYYYIMDYSLNYCTLYVFRILFSPNN